jgi:hypothetical protein
LHSRNTGFLIVDPFLQQGPLCSTIFLNVSYIRLRFLIGFLEGGFIPDVVLYLSYYYTKTERETSFSYIVRAPNTFVECRFALPGFGSRTT